MIFHDSKNETSASMTTTLLAIQRNQQIKQVHRPGGKMHSAALFLVHHCQICIALRGI
jgi:hypothetical protein